MNTLEILLKEKKVTKESLALKTKLSYPTFLKYCKEPMMFSISEFIRLSEGLDMSAKQLFKKLDVKL